MAFCINCGQELVEGTKFCYNCGAKNEVPQNSSSQRKIVYDGVIHKCPNCGETLNSFVLTCPSCGYEIRSVENISYVKQLALKLEKIDSERPALEESNALTQIIGMYRGMYLVSNTDKQKISLIKSFAIPNTKEDILEFVILASSNIDTKVYGFDRNTISPTEREISDSWYAKMEQAYQKAQIMFHDSEEHNYISKLYESKKQEIHKEKRKRAKILAGIIGGLIAMLVCCFLMIALN